MIISSGIILINDNNVLLVEPIYDGSEYELSFPKGEVHQNESLQFAAIRELYEETGITIERYMLQRVFTVNYINQGRVTKRVYLFLVKCDNKKIFVGNIQESEIRSAGFYSKQEAVIRIFWRFRHILFEKDIFVSK